MANWRKSIAFEWSYEFEISVLEEVSLYSLSSWSCSWWTQGSTIFWSSGQHRFLVLAIFLLAYSNLLSFLWSSWSSSSITGWTLTASLLQIEFNAYCFTYFIWLLVDLYYSYSLVLAGILNHWYSTMKNWIMQMSWCSSENWEPKIIKFFK